MFHILFFVVFFFRIGEVSYYIHTKRREKREREKSLIVAIFYIIENCKTSFKVTKKFVNPQDPHVSLRSVIKICSCYG